MSQEELIFDAILRANKWGAKGIQVVGFGVPQSAMQSPSYILIVDLAPGPETASETPWYDK